MSRVPAGADPMDEETKRMYDLVHYSGITLDPQLFGNITDLLKEDVHPDAILKVLKEASVSSPYNDPEKQKKIKRKSTQLSTRRSSPGPPSATLRASRRTLSPPREKRENSAPRRSMLSSATSSRSSTSK